MISEKLKRMLEKQHYVIVGKHSAVQICKYTKESLRGKDVCYKQKFYGIQSHRCCQMSPVVNLCHHRCVYCWRPIEFTSFTKLQQVDDPEEIIGGCIAAQRKLLSGFLANKNVSREKFFEAQEPKHFAISLIGEPTLYPKIGELILILREKGITSFLVTNGESPDVLKNLQRKNALPTQLYISLNASNEDLYKKICNPIGGSWENILKTLRLLRILKTRTVVRITLIKGLNTQQIEEYSSLLKTAKPNFVEIKAYMHIGFSQYRLSRENMPSHQEIKEFGKNIASSINYKILDEKENSRVVLLGKSNRDRFIKV
ncbi:MAG: 4-demethylwyosine synthase TYW1 [Candidatus Pacearchaeota archaeon]|nr:4-demethylwyosine synthase TYW1 [Candidatus Pacearchaeota archaeon]